MLVSVETVCADTSAAVDRLGRPAMPATAAAIEGRGTEASLLSPEKAAAESLGPGLQERLLRMRATQAYGTPDEVRRRLSAVAPRTAADELMLSTTVHVLCSGRPDALALPGRRLGLT
ncbi:hypothetical protein ABZZ36_23810 [Actinacidiphila glaucinigra]|uniref:hypothetical protein n=1 Tax=Actinacidiphila glaucinigra TaxID=235986 RepID=UPI0033B34B4A